MPYCQCSFGSCSAHWGTQIIDLGRKQIVLISSTSLHNDQHPEPAILTNHLSFMANNQICNLTKTSIQFPPYQTSFILMIIGSLGYVISGQQGVSCLLNSCGSRFLFFSLLRTWTKKWNIKASKMSKHSDWNRFRPSASFLFVFYSPVSLSWPPIAIYLLLKVVVWR